MATPSKEFPSLLFTPRPTEGRDAHRTPFAAQRSPSNVPNTGALFRTPSTIREASGRRSLTPTAGTPKDTPPAPPSDTLFDVRAGQDFGLVAGWRAETPQSASGAEAVSTTPKPRGKDGGARGYGSTPAATQGGAEQPPELMDSWVTVFGFEQVDLPLVLREFQKCGDVVRFDNFAQGTSVNWVHLQYQTKYGAQRALLKNGEQLSSHIIVGVKPLDQRHRQALSQQADFLLEPPKSRPGPVMPARAHRIGTAPSAPVPQADHSVWTRVCEVIFGM
eukprot:CAMPEP_0177785450 /NCGR_PEP_ID=MMETSP0491_2-20121128/20327_1 /TAXON_ID=63592 /ORGANISM="Tetraselmis chuii, Strain PLY429" /LENGTH=275 /DNA_ID=CAMNT_0019306457 /DNA_START=279 /DNA_END=1106 /DNA_ORIENTATION=+